jgi:hypothetical protein
LNSSEAAAAAAAAAASTHKHFSLTCRVLTTELKLPTETGTSYNVKCFIKISKHFHL